MGSEVAGAGTETKHPPFNMYRAVMHSYEGKSCVPPPPFCAQDGVTHYRLGRGECQNTGATCQKIDDFYLGRGHYPLLSYCLPGSPMNQANTRKLERDHTENVKRRVRVKKVFPSSLNHFCLLLVDNIISDRGPVRFGPLYKIYFCPTKHQ